jgi:penicillin-binding protein 1C
MTAPVVAAGRAGRRRRRGRILAAGLGALLVGAFVLDRVFPPDLARLATVSTVVVDRDGRMLRAFAAGDGAFRLATTPEDVAPIYLKILVAYEDRRFHGHPGVDPLALVRAFGQFVANGRAVSGASTLTMQAARLLEPGERDLVAKLGQMARALQLERRWSKREILTAYLTLAPFGGNIEGVRAASLAWFGKEPRHLTAGEAALLVALPQSPAAVRPDRHPEAAKKARDKILDRMAAVGVLTLAEAAEAKAEPIPTRRRALPFHAPHLAETLARDRPAGAARLVRTTLDRRLQAAVEGLAASEVGQFGPGATMAALIVDHRTGAVRAYLGSADYFAADRQGQVDMVRAVRSPGSTLKPFVYALGFDYGLIHPDTIVRDAPTRFGDYRPENFLRGYHGDVTVREALAQSLNIPAVAVLDGVGAERFVAALRAAGATMKFDTGDKPGLPVALGGVGTTLHDLVMLYAGMAQGGAVRRLSALADEPAGPEHRLTGAVSAWYVARILEAAPPPVDFVPGERAGRRNAVAYKTGTSYGFRDAWAIGSDGVHTIGVWVGRPDGTPSPNSYGRNTAAPLLFKLFDLVPESRSGSAGPVLAERPEGVLDGPTERLPASLQRYQPRARPRAVTAANEAPLVVSFPPNGAVVAVEPGRDGARRLALAAEGGKKPLRWIVNGRPIESSPFGRTAFWAPDGDGFVHVTVVDADGNSASSEARVK